MSICIIHLSDGKVAGVYSNTHEPMEVMVMERDGPRMTEEQQARYRAFQTMVKYGLVMDWQNPPYPVPCAPEFAPNLLDELLVRPKDGTADRERQRLELSYAMGYLAAQRKLRETLERLPARAGRLWRSSRRKSGISLESTRMISSRYFWSCARRRTVQMPLGERSA